MRVLIVTNMYPSRDEPWAGCFVAEQVEDLRARGISIEVMVIDGRQRRRNYLTAIWKLRRLLKNRQFDLIHAHYGLSGAVALCQRRCPVITTFHGSDTGYIRWQGWVSWFVARMSVSIFVAETGAANLGLSGATIVPAAVDMDRFRPTDRRDARRRLGWPEDGHYVLFPGARGNARKRADRFDAIVQHARTVRPDLRTVSLEGLSRSDVAVVMNAVDVTLMTSDFEGSPVAIKESLACMTPVVSVPVSDVPQLIDGLPGCTAAPLDIGELARALVTALESTRDPALRHRVEPFSRTRTAERIAALYEAVARAPS